MASLVQNEVDLPAIDMSLFPIIFEGQQGIHQLESHPMVAKLREACEGWGFFCIVNHGISESLQQNVESVIRELCDLPPQVREKAANPKISIAPYVEDFTFVDVPHSNAVQELSDRIWPHGGNPKFCEIVREYTIVLADLASKIMKMIIASLGLDVETVYQSEFDGLTAKMRINHYNHVVGGEGREEVMLLPHTDNPLLTILYQDNEQGLQIQSKEGVWFNVKALPNSFVINCGDTLKVWSNGRYHSGVHRVVHKGWVKRISLPFFVQFPDDKQVRAPDGLVDNDHPRRYRPFVYSQFIQDYFKDFRSDDRKTAAFVDLYAGVQV